LDKKTDGAKLTGLFEQKRSRGGLDCNRRDKEYIAKIRKKNFPLVPSPNFATIFKRKASNVSTDKKLKGVRHTERETSDSESNSSSDDS